MPALPSPAEAGRYSVLSFPSCGRQCLPDCRRQSLPASTSEMGTHWMSNLRLPADLQDDSLTLRRISLHNFTHEVGHQTKPSQPAQKTVRMILTARLVTRWLEGRSTPITCAVSAASRNRPPAVSTAATCEIDDTAQPTLLPNAYKEEDVRRRCHAGVTAAARPTKATWMHGVRSSAWQLKSRAHMTDSTPARRTLGCGIARPAAHLREAASPGAADHPARTPLATSRTWWHWYTPRHEAHTRA